MRGQDKFEDEFESQWRNAMGDVNIAPPKIVWSEIDRQLTHDKAGIYAKKIVYYRWAAAVLLLISSFAGFFVFDEMLNQSQLASNEGAVDKVVIPDSQSVCLDTLYENEIAYLESCGIEKGNSSIQRVDQNNAVGGMDFGAVEIASIEDPFQDNDMIMVESKAVDFEEVIPTLKTKLYKVASYLNIQTKSAKADQKQKYWAGLGFSSGGFDPNFSNAQSANSDVNKSLALSDATLFSNTAVEAVDASAPMVREGMTSGQSWSYGVDVGMRFGERWSLESGVQLMESTASNSTNVVIESTRYVESIPVTSQFSKVSQVQDLVESEEIVEYSYQDVDLNNRFQFLTIPVKAGYTLFEKKIGVKLNAGLLTSVYLGNELSNPTDDVIQVTLSPGKSSPYRDYSFTGIAGIQFTYEFWSRFNFVIEPSYRSALSDFTKESSSFDIAPSGMTIQTGLRFNFD